MSQYDNTNRGAIFKNDRKEKETHPDYRGKINVDGVDKEISLWVREKDGKKYFSAGVSDPYVKAENAETGKPIQEEAKNDDLPF